MTKRDCRALLVITLIVCSVLLNTAEAAKLISCPGVPSDSTCTVSLVALNGTTPTTIWTDQALTEITDPGGHGRSDYVAQYSSDLDPALEYRAYCHCVKTGTSFDWMYAWEPFENRVDVLLSSRGTSTFAGGAVASVTGSIGSLDTQAKADIENSVWNASRSGHTTGGSFGQGVGNVYGNVSGSVGAVTAPVTVATNNDKTGYSVSFIGDKTGYSLASVYDSAKSCASQASIESSLCLNLKNQVEDDIVYNSSGYKLSTKMYCYDSKANALLHDKSTGLIESYTASFTRSANNIITKMTVVKN